MTDVADLVCFSTAPPFDALAADLADLRGRGRERRLQPRAGIDFSSNDYLGLARSPRLGGAVAAAIARGVAIGSGGSRLLRGNDPEHEALETEAAAYFGSEAALYFATGYAANSALLATLPARGDLIVHDTLIHASAHEGMRLGRAEAVGAGHNDPARVEDAIVGWRRRGGVGRAWIAVESLYSMDGDCAPLGDLAAVAERQDAVLVIDEAHATGVFGDGGRGFAAGLAGQPNVITLRTCGKALGCEGALVCAPRVVCDGLINRGRSFIFSTAPSPLMASAVRESQRILADEPDRRERLATLIAAAAGAFTPLGVAPTGSQIVPVIIGDDVRAVEIAGALQRAGFDVRGIRPPSVPAGTARLRISLTLNVGVEDVARLADALGGGDRMSGAIVVTGTDTDAGKTVFAAALAGALGAYYWKPVQAGLDDGSDARRVAGLSGLSADRILPEAYRLTTPCSPHRAAEIDGITIDVDALRPPAVRPLVIEGAGGALVPVTRDVLFADLFARWALPTVIVARTALGTINHSLLTIEALRSRGVPIAGVAFVGDAVEDSETTIAAIGKVRRLGRLPWIAPLETAALAAAFRANFNREDFA